MLISTDVFLATHVNFNHLNKIEARYKVLSLNKKLSEVQLLRLRATLRALPIIFASVNFTHVRNYATLEINSYAP